MGAFSQQKAEREEQVSKFWSGENDGDSIKGKVVSAGLVPNPFDADKPKIPEIVLETDQGQVTITGTRKVLANLLFDLDPDTGDFVELTRTGTKPNSKPGWKPTVMYSGKNDGATREPVKASTPDPVLGSPAADDEPDF
jgi:hypothetical protein